MEYFNELITSIGNFWTTVYNNPGNTISIATLLVTAFAAIATGMAAIATRNSTKVSEATLIHTQKTSRRDEFISRYTLLLEQHKEQLSVVKSYLDTVPGKDFLDKLIDETSHLTAFNTLHGHSIVSPYMRVLYHLLRHISMYYDDNASTKDKKMYSSTVRSLIRNDVLFLIAVNSSYVIKDNKENDYGKYQKLLREFDFFEHALFFSANVQEPGLNKDAVSKAGNQVIKRFKNNHYLTISYDKSYLSYEHENFSMPFIVSCIYDNPLHKESIACLDGMGSRVKEEAKTACERYVAQYKTQGEKGFTHSDYYGRKYFNETDSLRSELNKNWRIDPDVYQNLPEVDDRYIETYLTELKAGRPEALPVHCYIRTFGMNNSVNLRNSKDFLKDCEGLLSWQKHLQCVQNGEADREYIQRGLQELSDFRSAVLRQRLMA
jgi:hypothetical protein